MRVWWGLLFVRVHQAPDPLDATHYVEVAGVRRHCRPSVAGPHASAARPSLFCSLLATTTQTPSGSLLLRSSLAPLYTHPHTTRARTHKPPGHALCASRCACCSTAPTQGRPRHLPTRKSFFVACSSLTATSRTCPCTRRCHRASAQLKSILVGAGPPASTRATALRMACVGVHWHGCMRVGLGPCSRARVRGPRTIPDRAWPCICINSFMRPLAGVFVGWRGCGCVYSWMGKIRRMR